MKGISIKHLQKRIIRKYYGFTLAVARNPISGIPLPAPKSFIIDFIMSSYSGKITMTSTEKESGEVIEFEENPAGILV